MTSGGTYKITDPRKPVAMPAWLLAMIRAHCNLRRERAAPPPVQIHEGVGEAMAQVIPLWAPHELAEIKNTLSHIPADDYWVWFKVGAALQNEFGDEIGFELFDDWSRTSAKYKAWQCKRKWRDCAQVHSISIGTVYHLAAELDEAIESIAQGLEQPEPPTKVVDLSGQPVDEHGVPLVPLQQSDWIRRTLPDPVFLCGKWLTTTSRTLVTAETGIGKTMWSLGLGTAMGAGKQFLIWQCAQVSRVLLVDGEMARQSLQRRIIEERNRLGCPSEGFYVLSHEDLEGAWQPLNTEAGQKLMERQIKLVNPQCIIFDNIMSLLHGDQKDEETWSAVLPWVLSLTRRNIAQVWLHHSGHDATRSYGTKTREWQMDNHLHFTKAEGQSDICFDLVFKKHRDRTPETRADFADMQVSLQDGQWVWSTPEGGHREELGPTQRKFYDALCFATSQSGQQMNGHPAATQEAWRIACINRGLFDPAHQQTAFATNRRRLIEADWVVCDLTMAWTVGPNREAIL
jgi:hypothetical protein